MKAWAFLFSSHAFLDLCSVYVYTTIMKTKNQYPEWAEKFRSKEHTIRKVRNGYGLYKCTSVYVSGAPYPKSVQEYLGMITEEDGFIPKKTVTDHPNYIEYGLSHFIWLNFRRDLQRASYQSLEGLLRLGVVKYIFGNVSEELLPYTFISDGHAEEMVRVLQSSSMQRIDNLAKKIDVLLTKRIPGQAERTVLEGLLRCCVLDAKNKLSQTPALPEKAREIIERNGLRYGNGKKRNVNEQHHQRTDRDQ